MILPFSSAPAAPHRPRVAAPVRPAVVLWLAAVAVGIGETVLHLAEPDPPSTTALAVRAGIYAGVVALILALGAGRRGVRPALVLLLGVLGTASLVVEPVTWLQAGGSPTAYLADASPLAWGVVVLRIAHLGLVAAATASMFTPTANRFLARPARAERPDPRPGPGPVTHGPYREVP